MSQEQKQKDISPIHSPSSMQRADAPSSQRTMGFFDHLDELRARLIRILAVFFVGFLFCLEYSNPWVLSFLRAPLVAAVGESAAKLNILSPFELFLNQLKMAGVSAFFVVSPYIFYQVWAFIAPGLLPRERKFVMPFVLGASGCFIGGAAFAYYVLFPIAFKFLIGNHDPNTQVMLSLSAYYSTCLKLLLLFGFSFELPVFLCLLGFLGIVDGNTLRKNRSTAIIAITVLCALFAPPDAISMLILMAPLILLYEISILIVDVLTRQRSQAN